MKNKMKDKIIKDISFKDIIFENVTIIFLVILLIIGSIVSDKFLSSNNLMNILGRISISSFVAFGFTFVFLTGGFDLSVGSIVSVCAVMTVGLINAGLPWPIAIFIILIIGLIYGFINGIILSLIRADLSATFLITLGTQLLGASVALTYTGGFQLYFENIAGKKFLDSLRIEILRLPVIVIVMILCAILFQILLSKTKIGREVYLVGGNKISAFLAGIKVNRIRIFSFMMSGLCCAISAIFITVRTTGASPKSGYGFEFDAALAVIIGGNVLGGGKGGMLRTITGVLILAIILNIMNLVGIEPQVQRIIQGTILISAVMMNTIKSSNIKLFPKKNRSSTV